MEGKIHSETRFPYNVILSLRVIGEGDLQTSPTLTTGGCRYLLNTYQEVPNWQRAICNRLQGTKPLVLGESFKKT